MQPPPRKTKISVSQLKTVQSEQISKLQHKHQHELDQLEDIRVFTKQRSSIEKEYAQALCKLAQQYLSKSKFTPPPILSEEDKDAKKNPGRTVSEVWKTVLEETDRVGKIRLQAADTYLQLISDPVKPIKTSKAGVAKKVFEHLKVMHKEIDTQVLELGKSQKVYNEDEHVTLEATSKANDADARVKNKSTGLFTSLAKLQQQSAKLNNRKEACEIKSTSSRNDYLLNLAAANAQLDQYYVNELPELIKSLDGEMFDKVRDFFITLSKMEVDCCGLTQERFMKILTDSTMISRQFDQQCFLHTNLVFTDKMQYSFEPQEHDSISKISLDHSAPDRLKDEAKKLAEQAARDGKVIRINQRKLNLLINPTSNGTPRTQSESGEPQSPTSPVDNEAKMEDIKQIIRKAELSKRKADAKIDALRQGGVKVDELISQAEAKAEAEEAEEEVSYRTSVSASIRSESVGGTSTGTTATGGPDSRPVSQTVDTSGEDSKNRSRSESQVDGANGSVTSPPPDGSTYVNYQEDDFDETFTATEASQGQQEEGSMGYASLGQNIPLKSTAIYDFQASNGDELSITENEPLEVIGEGEGDGWVQARNASGQVGMVPLNYIHYIDTVSTATIEDQNEMNVDHDTNGDIDLTAGCASYESSSVTSASAPTSAGYDSLPPSAGYDTGTQGSFGERSSSYSTTDYEVQQAIRPTDVPTDGMWARALYDFEATSEEELSFQEGQLIRILQKDENGVDDGWWKGEINGKTGVFPSLVVEEISSASTSEDITSPNRPGPPSFTPPEPGPPPPQLEVTQPTPSDESGPTINNNNVTGAPSSDGPAEPMAQDGPAAPTAQDGPAAPTAQDGPAAQDVTQPAPPSEEPSEPLPPPPEDVPPSEDIPLPVDVPPPEALPLAEDMPLPDDIPPLETEHSIDTALIAMPKSGLTPSVSEEQNDDNMSTQVNYNSDSVDTFSTVNDEEHKLEQKESLAGESPLINGTVSAEEGVGDCDGTATKKSPGIAEQVVEVEIHHEPEDDLMDLPPPPPLQPDDVSSSNVKLTDDDLDNSESIL